MKNNQTLMRRLGLTFGALLLAASSQASSVNLTFTSPGGTITDSNGVATGFTARLSGTGSGITGGDTNLFLDTTNGVLVLRTSEGTDFNGGNGLALGTVVGFQLSTLGFHGTNDFFVSATYTNLPDNTVVLQPAQLCLVVGTSASNLVRAGFINFDLVNNNFGTNARDNEDFACNNTNGADIDDVFFGTDVGTGMNVQMSRVGGTWTISVNGRNDIPNTAVQRNGTPVPPDFLDSAPDLFVGVCALDVAGTSPWSVQLNNFSASVVENVTAPTINSLSAQQLVNEGNPVTFSVGLTASSASPRTYQWYDNNVPLAGETNSTLTFFPDATNAGSIFVAITNALGATNSTPLPLYVVTPISSLTLNFTSTNAGGLLDANGLGTGFPSRLPGTGTVYTNDDPNFMLDAPDGILNIASTYGDFNIAGDTTASDAINESPGVSLNSLGFTGSQDVNANLVFPTLPASVSFCSSGLYIGQDTNFLTRAGWIDFTALGSPKGKERYSENIQPTTNGPSNGGGQYFGFGFDPAVLPMTVQIDRTAGIWHAYIDGVQWDVLTQPTLTGTNLTAGVFVYDTGGGSYTQPVSLFQARVFSPPTLKITAANGQLTLSWNVAGGGLQQSMSLTGSSGWAPVPGALSPYTIPLPKTGNLYFRLSL